MKSPITHIKDDHIKIKELFSSYEELSDSSSERKREIADHILKELGTHAKMEEKIVYPKLKEAFTDEHDKLIEEARAEHHAAKVLMVELRVLPVTNPQFDAKMKVLKENTEHHIQEEEGVVLPLTEQVLRQEEMDTMAEKMEKFKEDSKKDLLEKIFS